MGSRLKQGVYQASKALGLFRLARFLTRSELRILGYHGIALRDEAAFRPGLFIEPDTFAQRLRHLEEANYPVLGLEEALERLERGDLPPCATVITVDDGFYSTFRHALLALRRHAFPATVYVTSYYALRDAPVFRLAVQYLFWSARTPSVRPGELGLPWVGNVALADPGACDKAMWSIIRHGEETLDEPGRHALVDALARQLGLDGQSLQRDRLVSLMTPAEVSRLAEAGVDVQLHTHRHRLPVQRSQTRREIEENRSSLEPLVGRPLHHFCYPSGLWSPRHWGWLQRLGVESATTCDVGLNDRDTPRLALRRFLDGAHVSTIEFEAEVSGFAELVRRARDALLRLAPAPLSARIPKVTTAAH